MYAVTTMPDLGPQANEVKMLLDGVADDRLDAPTPCPEYSVEGMLNHLLGLTAAFRDAARKDLGANTGADPLGESPSLPADWRSRLSRQLDELAEAWRSEDAWEGQTQAGGVTLPGAVAGMVALNEIVLHGWDLARATDQPYLGDPDSLRASIDLLSQSMEAEMRNSIFGPVVDVPAEAPLLDRAVGLSGRRPDWTSAPAA